MNNMNSIVHRNQVWVLGLLLILAVLVMARPVFAADRVDLLYGKAAEKYHRLYDDPVYASKTDNWLRTIKQFRILHQTYPDHRRAPASIYNMARLYRSLFQVKKRHIFLDRSNLSFRRLVKKYPQSTLADDAQFLLAYNYERLEKNKDLAYLEYKNLIAWFPQSQFVPEAEKRIKLLRPLHKDLRVYSVEESTALPIELTKVRYGGLSEESDDRTRPMVKVTKIDYWSTTDWSRMVINAGSDVRYRYRILQSDASYPNKRLVVDIFHAYLPEKSKRKIAANDGLITEARIAQFDKKTVRVVMDMVSLEKFKIFHFKLPLQYKIVIDILGENDLSKLKKPKDPDGEIDHADGSSEDEQVEYQGDLALNGDVSLQKVLGLKVRRVILDPGHGGRDPGASAFGLREKDVTLGIAKELKRMIKKNHPQIDVLLTRQKDRYIKLEARTAFANKNRGDLFISLHVNASLRPSVRGTETYFLNLTSDAQALSLAAKENQTSMKSISDLQNILNDLLTNSKIQESNELASKIQTSIIDLTTNSIHRMRDLGVKKAPFLVLLGAQMPSVLVETGFISNKEENKFLRDKKYRRILAKGIYQGIRSYMN